MANKYFAKPSFYDIKNNCILEYHPAGALPNNVMRFDSQLELKVFLILIQIYDLDMIERQYKIRLKPRTKWSDAMFYVADFYVACGEPFCVEAKGLMTPESKIKIKMLEVEYPAMRANLILVSDKATYYFGKHYAPSVSIGNLRNELLK